MLEGQVIYRDFFEFLPPGIDLVYLTILKFVGSHAWVPNALLVLLGVCLANLCIVISKHLFRGGDAYLPGLLFVVVAFRSGLDGTHHWFSVLAVLAAIAIMLKERTLARVAAAGALCGIASDFTTTRGVVAVIALGVFLLWEARRKGQDWRRVWLCEAVLLTSFLIPFVAFNAYFAWKVGLQRFLECTVLFPAEYYPADARWNSLQVYMTEVPRFLPWYRLPALGVWLFIHSLQPLIYLLFFSRYWRQERITPHEPWEQLMLLSIAGLSLFAGVAPAPGLVRLCSISLPALILFVWFVQASEKYKRTGVRLLWVAALILAVGATVERQARWKKFLDMPTGRTASLYPASYERYQWLLQHTRPSEYFFEGDFADMYFPLALRNPAKVPFLTNTDYTRPEQVQDVVASLERHRVRFVLWSLLLDVPREKPAGDHLEPLREYLREHYRVAHTFSDFAQVWERVE